MKATCPCVVEKTVDSIRRTLVSSAVAGDLACLDIDVEEASPRIARMLLRLTSIGVSRESYRLDASLSNQSVGRNADYGDDSNDLAGLVRLPNVAADFRWIHKILKSNVVQSGPKLIKNIH